MTAILFRGLMIPFLGTSLGASCVWFMKNRLCAGLRRALLGFAAGVMVAASVWSLLLPAIEQSDPYGKLSFLPAAVGFCVGILFLLLLDRIFPCAQAAQTETKRVTMLVLAVVLHNIPEGMAVGVVFAGLRMGQPNISLSGAMLLSFGIAVQNFPEGAIISMPLAAQGMRKGPAFVRGVLSGIVEPIAGAATVLLSGAVVPVLPYLLSFAAGAMLYVGIAELVPEMTEGGCSRAGTVLFTAGFVLMMALDVALG